VLRVDPQVGAKLGSSPGRAEVSGDRGSQVSEEMVVDTGSTSTAIPTGVAEELGVIVEQPMGGMLNVSFL